MLVGTGGGVISPAPTGAGAATHVASTAMPARGLFVFMLVSSLFHLQLPRLNSSRSYRSKPGRASRHDETYLIGTARTSAPTHSPGLSWKRSGVKFVWHSTHAVCSLLLSGTERRYSHV